MRRDIGGPQAEEEDNEINLTPMLDVVFIMLIFFIVTASFVRESGIDVNKPDAPVETPPDNDDANILIRIAANDDIYIDRRLIDKRAVRANIERLSAENPDGIVVILPANDSSNNTLVEIMNASRLAGIYNVSIAEAY